MLFKIRANSARRLLAMGLFDAEYISQAGKARTVQKYASLYCKGGWHRGIEPNAYFDSPWYAEEYPDWISHGTPLMHFATVGWRQGNAASPRFSVRDYLFDNPDVQRALVNPLSHFLMHGRAENRDVRPHRGRDEAYQRLSKSALFDRAWYLTRYPDIDPNQVDPLEHYCVYGWREGRKPNALFDPEWFVEHCGQVRVQGNPALFYLEEGWRSGLNPSKAFDGNRYLEANRDVRDIGLCPLEHYLLHGRFEGRDTYEIDERKGGAIGHSRLIGHIGLRWFADYRPGSTSAKDFDSARLSIHVVVPDFSAGGGGHMTIFRICRYLELRGHDLTIWILAPVVHNSVSEAHETLVKEYLPLAAQVKMLGSAFFDNEGDAVIATSWETVWPVVSTKSFIKRFYFVQDFEPFFYPTGSLSIAAEATYRQDLDCLCASPWLARKLREDYGRWTCHFWLSIDHNVYGPSVATPTPKLPRIAFYARRGTERRAVELGLLALEELAARGVDFHVELFGADLNFSSATFDFTSHGILDHAALAALYGECTIGIVFSATNYSLVPQEMMACGLPVVDLRTSSNVEIFPPGTVTLSEPDPRSIADSLRSLIFDEVRRNTQRDVASRWVAGLSWDDAGKVVEDAIISRMRANANDLNQNVRPRRLQSVVKASVVIPTLNAGSIFRKVIEAIKAQECPWKYELVVIDSGSQDQTLNMLEGVDNLVVHKIPGSQFNHGATRNLAVSLSKGEFVAFITQDAIPAHKHWLFDLVQSLERHKNAAGIFGKHKAHVGASPFTVRDIREHVRRFDKGPIAVDLATNPHKWRDKDTSWLQYLFFYSDNNSCLRKSIWEKLPMPAAEYGEDQLWARDIIRCGYQKLYSPGAIVYHSHDYDENDTFSRAAVEGEFFLKNFGWHAVSPTANIDSLIRDLNNNDEEFAKKYDIDHVLLQKRFNLNKARVRGLAHGQGLTRNTLPFDP
jgi:glycosyltransferase involved in cell wall biosynthesis